MFTGDDDLLDLIQTEAITLVDSILEESVTVVNNNSSPFNPSSIAQESDFMQHDEHQLSHQLSLDENSYDQLQQQFQLPLINVNNYSINPSSDQAHSDDISDNFAIKSDCDIIVKSPTIESMSGKSFEDVDDEYNLSSSAIHDVNVESSLNHNTAANIMTSSSSPVPHPTIFEEAYCSSDDEDNVQADAQNLDDADLYGTVDPVDEYSSSDDIQAEAENLVGAVLGKTVAFLEDKPSKSDVKSSTVSFLASEIAGSAENPAIVRNISEHKLHRVERKFEHLSSEARDDDPDSVDLDCLVNKDDVSMLQNDFSKISWDESLSANTGDLAGDSSTPDNDLQDVLNIPGDTYRYQHNK
jgi:hypothetical protein